MCWWLMFVWDYTAVCQNLVPLVNIKIAGKWMFIPLKMVFIGIDPYPYSSFDCSMRILESNLGIITTNLYTSSCK